MVGDKGSSTISSNQPTRVIKHLQEIARRSPASHGDIKDKRYLADKYFSEDPAIGEVKARSAGRKLPVTRCNFHVCGFSWNHA